MDSAQKSEHVGPIRLKHPSSLEKKAVKRSLRAINTVICQYLSSVMAVTSIVDWSPVHGHHEATQSPGCPQDQLELMQSAEVYVSADVGLVVLYLSILAREGRQSTVVLYVQCAVSSDIFHSTQRSAYP